MKKLWCTFSLTAIQATSAFSPAQLQSSPPAGRTMAMAKDQKFPPARRTSSVAYDNGCQEKYNRVDLWRKRRNLPPTALSSSSSLTEEDETKLEDEIKPIYTVGVLADIQYAPIPDGHSYAGNPRYYRHAKEAAKHAAEHFQEEGVHCVLNLGDIIDGKCSDVERWGGSVEEEKKTSGSSVGHEAIDDVLEALSAYNLGQILHTYGNHELYNLSREELGRKLSIPFTLEPTNDLVGYYEHLLHQPQQPSATKVRFLVLDSYDVCLLGRCPESSHKRQAAHEILAANNHNYPEEENSPEGLEGIQRRFVGFNGGVDEPQMEWLKNSLQNARENDERVIICSHQPLHPESTWPTCLVWNYEEVLTILRSFSDVVVASFSGHAHKGGYVRDEGSGIHFRVFPAVLESPHPVRTYALLDVFETHLEVRGMGDCVSDVYDLDHLTTESGADA